ncbi:hypothetical protein U9M48_033373 [Paspalum notatum var. saurae]|uniref:Uncharacterized protein n=1 Tax=Paspalum notatum var. saurae TaxID=547442 RepID=A0AAQ3X6J7_PASNO
MDSTLTNLSPAPELAPPRRGQGWRDLFHAAASPSTTGNTNLDKLVPNLHHRAEDRRSPSHPRPRPRGPPEVREISGLAGGSTGGLLFASPNCSRGKEG